MPAGNRGFGLGRVVAALGQQQISLNPMNLRLDIALAHLFGQCRRLAQRAKALAVPAAACQSLREQDQKMGALNPRAGRTISRQTRAHSTSFKTREKFTAHALCRPVSKGPSPLSKERPTHPASRAGPRCLRTVVIRSLRAKRIVYCR